MNKEDKKGGLVGQVIEVYLDGGWSISGDVKRSDDNRIFIENNNEIYMVYRSKISAVCLNFKKAEIPGDGPGGSGGKENEASPSWPGELIPTESTQSLSLPLDMLTSEAQDSYSDNDLSIHFGRGSFAGKGRGDDS